TSSADKKNPPTSDDTRKASGTVPANPQEKPTSKETPSNPENPEATATPSKKEHLSNDPTADAKVEQNAKGSPPSPTSDTKAAEEKTNLEHNGTNHTLVVWFLIIVALIFVVILFFIYSLIVPRKDSTSKSGHKKPSATKNGTEADQSAPDYNYSNILTQIKALNATINTINQQQGKILTEFNVLMAATMLNKKSMEKQCQPMIVSKPPEDIPRKSEPEIARPKQPHLDEDGKLALKSNIRCSIMYETLPTGYVRRSVFLQPDPKGNYLIVPDEKGNTAKCYPIDMELIDPYDTDVYKIERSPGKPWQIITPATCKITDPNKYTSITRGHIVGPTKK
ncbi:MAG: hypothetical protein HQK96_21495, partial [Nitrospirae bacterium]|nr:hypothetical protein [Nitrospirota bacterium]